ncbi:MAG: carboxymuconolactone decarboxylase family protein [Leptospiraceae bacterium]|nr:carboxymuconolactone decarboxylase family protein [Leptospiraceae bacterium]
MAYIKEPNRMNLFSKIIIRSIEKYMGAKLEIARVLLWYPKAALSSILLESLITFNDREVNKRLLKLIRMQVSISSSCAFCIDMNFSDYQLHNISIQEIETLQGKVEIEKVSTFSAKEKAALNYAKELTLTKGNIQSETIQKLKQEFSERAILIIASTIAQVSYWTVLMQGLGIQPLGFLKDCPVIDFKK